MTTLITGGTGFIGPHVVHALRARDEHVQVPRTSSSKCDSHSMQTYS